MFLNFRAKISHFVDKLHVEMKKNIRPDQKLIAAGKIRPENLSELHNLVNLEYYHGKKIINY